MTVEKEEYKTLVDMESDMSNEEKSKEIYITIDDIEIQISENSINYQLNNNTKKLCSFNELKSNSVSKITNKLDDDILLSNSLKEELELLKTDLNIYWISKLDLFETTYYYDKESLPFYIKTEFESKLLSDIKIKTHDKNGDPTEFLQLIKSNETYNLSNLSTDDLLVRIKDNENEIEIYNSKIESINKSIHKFYIFVFIILFISALLLNSIIPIIPALMLFIHYYKDIKSNYTVRKRINKKITSIHYYNDDNIITNNSITTNNDNEYINIG